MKFITDIWHPNGRYRCNTLRIFDFAFYKWSQINRGCISLRYVLFCMFCVECPSIWNRHKIHYSNQSRHSEGILWSFPGKKGLFFPLFFFLTITLFCPEKSICKMLWKLFCFFPHLQLTRMEMYVFLFYTSLERTNMAMRNQRSAGCPSTLWKPSWLVLSLCWQTQMVTHQPMWMLQ